jgi:hypothetical protein
LNLFRFAPLRQSEEELNENQHIVFDSYGFDIEDYLYPEDQILKALANASIIHIDRPDTYVFR